MIKVLPSHIANLIAAGEVVQRPASVVKELMENAVDAGSQNIQVIIKDSGRTLIQVIDNGCGLSPEDAKTAFLRHATSKIEQIEDLSTIHTFGFRGEALASICSVAQVTLRTKKEDEETGYEVKYAESALVGENPTATPTGSNFIVRNLFYNVPARRKFLKTDATEFRQIVQEFSRIAITRPNLSFRLTHNDNEIMILSPAPIKKRIQEVVGKEMIKELVEISVDTSIVKISGYVGKPEDSRKTPGNQYLFVNNRYFRSPYFHKAILKAYDGLIVNGLLPSYFIFFEVETNKIDVNIHPSKTEVKFEDDYAIFDILTSGVKESLGKNAFMPSIEFDMEDAPDIPRVNTSYYVAPPKINYDPLFNPFDEEKKREQREDGAFVDREFHNGYGQDHQDLGTENQGSGTGNQEYSRRYQDYGAAYNEMDPLFSDTSISHKPVLQVACKYIVTTIKTGLLLIDIRRAKERILYERYINTLSTGNNLTQQSLFPQEAQVDLQTLSILEENQTTLRYMGFDFTLLENSIVVNGLPQGFNDNSDSLGSLIDNLAHELSEDGKDFSKKSKERLARQLAHSGSSGKLEPLNNLEAQTLIDTLFACKEPNYTPQGNKCYIILDTQEIENKLL